MRVAVTFPGELCCSGHDATAAPATCHGRMCLRCCRAPTQEVGPAARAARVRSAEPRSCECAVWWRAQFCEGRAATRNPPHTFSDGAGRASLLFARRVTAHGYGCIPAHGASGPAIIAGSYARSRGLWEVSIALHDRWHLLFVLPRSPLSTMPIRSNHPYRAGGCLGPTALALRSIHPVLVCVGCPWLELPLPAFVSSALPPACATPPHPLRSCPGCP